MTTTVVSSRRAGQWLSRVEILLYAVGIVLLGSFVAGRVGAQREQAALSAELSRQTAALRSQPGYTTARVTRPEPAPGSVVARLEMPRLGISAVAREGADERTLRRAVGHVPATALPGEQGNTAFAGHRDTFFRALRGVRTGDRIVLTTATGRHEYVVKGTRVVDPTEVSVLRPTPTATLTLITCYPFTYIGPAPRRFIVSAALAPPVDAN